MGKIAKFCSQFPEIYKISFYSVQKNNFEKLKTSIGYKLYYNC